MPDIMTGTCYHDILTEQGERSNCPPGASIQAEVGGKLSMTHVCKVS